MTTVKLTYDARNSVAQTIMQLIHKVGVFKVEKEEECPYDKKFMAKTERSRKEFEAGKYKAIKVEDLWK